MSAEQLAVPRIDFSYHAMRGNTGFFSFKTLSKTAKEAVELTSEAEGLPEFLRPSPFDNLFAALTAISAANTAGEIHSATDSESLSVELRLNEGAGQTRETYSLFKLLTKVTEAQQQFGVPDSETHTLARPFIRYDDYAGIASFIIATRSFEAFRNRLTPNDVAEVRQEIVDFFTGLHPGLREPAEEFKFYAGGPALLHANYGCTFGRHGPFLEQDDYLKSSYHRLRPSSGDYYVADSHNTDESVADIEIAALVAVGAINRMMLERGV